MMAGVSDKSAVVHGNDVCKICCQDTCLEQLIALFSETSGGRQITCLELQYIPSKITSKTRVRQRCYASGV